MLYYYNQKDNIVIPESYADSKMRSYVVETPYELKRLKNRIRQKDDLELDVVNDNFYPAVVSIINKKIKTNKPFDASKHKHYLLKSGGYPLPSMYLEIMNVRSEELVYDVPGVYEELFNYVDKFFASKDFYAREKIFYKTGVLLYGPPGCGKTSWIRKLITSSAVKDSVVIWCDVLPDLEFQKELKLFPGPKIFIFEELTSMIHNSQDVAEFLEFMDGEKSIDNAIYIATTNYPENLPGNIVERPGRFDKILKFDNPDDKLRKYLFEDVYKVQTTDEIIKASKDFSIAQIKEVYLQMKIHNKSVEEAIKYIKDHRQLVKNAFADVRKLGL